jgi:DNA-binding transcriptional ArsR family regulator
MTTVPPEVKRLLAELAHPNRLPILIALEQRPRGATELAGDLELDLDAVNWALKRLRREGLVVIQRHAVMPSNIKFAIYATANRKWKGILTAASAVAATTANPATKRGGH